MSPILQGPRRKHKAQRGEDTLELTVKLGEVVHQMGVQDLILQQVLFVEEEEDRRVLEPGVGDDGPK